METSCRSIDDWLDEPLGLAVAALAAIINMILVATLGANYLAEGAPVLWKESWPGESWLLIPVSLTLSIVGAYLVLLVGFLIFAVVSSLSRCTPLTVVIVFASCALYLRSIDRFTRTVQEHLGMPLPVLSVVGLWLIALASYGSWIVVSGLLEHRPTWVRTVGVLAALLWLTAIVSLTVKLSSSPIDPSNRATFILVLLGSFLLAILTVSRRLRGSWDPL